LQDLTATSQRDQVVGGLVIPNQSAKLLGLALVQARHRRRVAKDLTDHLLIEVQTLALAIDWHELQRLYELDKPLSTLAVEGD